MVINTPKVPTVPVAPAKLSDGAEGDTVSSTEAPAEVPTALVAWRV
jgi:hypothetical protein